MTVRRVLHQLLQWICAVPVVEFNSQCYGLNVLKSLLMRSLVCVCVWTLLRMVVMVILMMMMTVTALPVVPAQTLAIVTVVRLVTDW